MGPGNHSFAYLKAPLASTHLLQPMAAIRKVCALVAESSSGTCLAAYPWVRPGGMRNSNSLSRQQPCLRGKVQNSSKSFAVWLALLYCGHGLGPAEMRSSAFLLRQAHWNSCCLSHWSLQHHSAVVSQRPTGPFYQWGKLRHRRENHLAAFSQTQAEPEPAQFSRRDPCEQSPVQQVLHKAGLGISGFTLVPSKNWHFFPPKKYVFFSQN